MSSDTRFTPKAYQVVSDLGQLTVFVDPLKTGILRILQQQEATSTEVASLVGKPETTVTELIGGLCDLGLVKVVGQQARGQDIEYVYRATARLYFPRPEPEDLGTASASISYASMMATHMDSVTREVVASLEKWPVQDGNYEGRRADLPRAAG